MKVLVPATSANLGPGFDALGLSIALYNEVVIKPASFTSICIMGEGKDSANLKRNNLFLNIFKEVYLELAQKLPNFRIIFENRIPFSRGLGSSSAVIISAIVCAYEMAGFKACKNTVLNKALMYENHPDNIAPATLGGFVSSVVENNKVIYNKLNLSNDIKAVVVIPDKPMSTAQSRTVLPKHFTTKECVFSLSHAALLATCFASRRYDLLKSACIDIMHEQRRMSALPELFEVRKEAYEFGALMSSLSGSGSSFLNIAYSDDATKLARHLKNKFNHFRVEVFDFDNEGFCILQS